MAPDELLKQAIELSGVAEVVKQSSDASTVKVLHRVGDKQTWMSILEYVLPRATCWSAHVCQQYFMRGGKLVYGWNFILQPNEDVSLDDALTEVTRLLAEGARVIPQAQSLVQGPLDSMPLIGASPARTSKIAFDPRMPGPGKGGPSHKGAYPIGAGD